MSGLGAMIAKESYSRGMEQGLSQGLSQGISRGLSQGISQGLSQGLSQGRAQGEAMVTRLIVCLLADGRMGDVERAATDEEARQELYRQYGITE